MSSLKKLFVIVVIVVALFAVVEYASAAGTQGSSYRTCAKAICYKYNSNGTYRYNKVMGVSYKSFVLSGSKVYGQSVNATWFKQTIFGSQSVYYKTVDFK